MAFTRHSQRRKTYNDLGHAHELTSSCFQGYPFLKAERCCQWLADAITDARVKHSFDVWAFVFMPNHFHLIIHPREPTYDISKIIYSIKSPVGREAVIYLQKNSPEWLAKITRQRGNRVERLFWQSGGGYDRNIVERGTLLSMIDYLHLNPVRKALVAKPEHWKWSSAALFAGESLLPLDRIPPEWLRE